MSISYSEKFSQRELEILRKRAERAAQAVHETQTEQLITALIVYVGSEKYALPIEAVSNTYINVRITPVPYVPAYISGIANVRGHIVLVIDLANILGISQEPQNNAHTLIMMAAEELGAALRIGSVEGVETIPISKLTAIPSNVEMSQSNHMKGILPDGAVLLDIDAILNELVLADSATRRV